MSVAICACGNPYSDLVQLKPSIEITVLVVKFHAFS